MSKFSQYVHTNGTLNPTFRHLKISNFRIWINQPDRPIFMKFFYQKESTCCFYPISKKWNILVMIPLRYWNFRGQIAKKGQFPKSSKSHLGRNFCRMQKFLPNILWKKTYMIASKSAESFRSFWWVVFKISRLQKDTFSFRPHGRPLRKHGTFCDVWFLQVKRLFTHFDF